MMQPTPGDFVRVRHQDYPEHPEGMWGTVITGPTTPPDPLYLAKLTAEVGGEQVVVRECEVLEIWDHSAGGDRPG